MYWGDCQLIHCLPTMIIDHFELSLVKAICLYCCPCPVVGQVTSYCSKRFVCIVVLVQSLVRWPLIVQSDLFVLLSLSSHWSGDQRWMDCGIHKDLHCCQLIFLLSIPPKKVLYDKLLVPRYHTILYVSLFHRYIYLFTYIVRS